MVAVRTPTDIAEELIDALAAQDFDRVESCFAPDVSFHAVVPGTGSFRERVGAAETASQLQMWLAGSRSSTSFAAGSGRCRSARRFRARA